MVSNKECFVDKMEFLLVIFQLNIYLLLWNSKIKKLQEVWEVLLCEVWDLEKLFWDMLDVDSYIWEECEFIVYWWSLFLVFDVLVLLVFVEVLIKIYEVYEEDLVCKCFFLVICDEQNYEIMCGLVIIKLLNYFDLLIYVLKIEFGKCLQKNVVWLYFNGGCYWIGYKQVVLKYDLVVLFSFFLMGEIVVVIIFKQMYENFCEVVFKEGFKNIGCDEGCYMVICMVVMECDYLGFKDEIKVIVIKQICVGYLFLLVVLFELLMEFWDLFVDFIVIQCEVEEVVCGVGFGILSYEVKLENWKNVMINLKGVFDCYNILFLVILEVGIIGQEVLEIDMEDIILVF